MFESIIVLSLYVAFLEACLSPLKDKLQKSTNVDESVSIRRKMKWIRNTTLVGFLLLYLVIGPVIVAQMSEVTWSQYWLGGSTPAFGILIYNIWQASSLRINTIYQELKTRSITAFPFIFR